jgi:predicted Zn-dependent peptidase
MIYDEFERVKVLGVTPDEMKKVLTQDRLQIAELHASTLNRARNLGWYTVYFHDPDLVNSLLEKYKNFTPADIQRVARQYLGADQRTVVWTNPKPQQNAASAQ